MIRHCPIADMAIGAENVAVTILANLRLALEDLAATPDQQAQRLKEIGTYPSVDEFGLDYDNWAQASWQLVESGEITESTHSAILQLNERIEEFGGKQSAAEWDVSALATSSNWRDVRERARKILSELNAV